MASGIPKRKRGKQTKTKAPDSVEIMELDEVRYANALEIIGEAEESSMVDDFDMPDKDLEAEECDDRCFKDEIEIDEEDSSPQNLPRHFYIHPDQTDVLEFEFCGFKYGDAVNLPWKIFLPYLKQESSIHKFSEPMPEEARVKSWTAKFVNGPLPRASMFHRKDGSLVTRVELHVPVEVEAVIYGKHSGREIHFSRTIEIPLRALAGQRNQKKDATSSAPRQRELVFSN